MLKINSVEKENLSYELHCHQLGMNQTVEDTFIRRHRTGVYLKTNEVKMHLSNREMFIKNELNKGRK